MAGSKMNKKFVLVLGAGVVGVLGLLLGAAYLVLYNTAEELAAMGDKAMASGRYSEAAIYYSKACDREKTNAEYFRKWRESIANQIPDTQVKYQEALQGYRGATRQLAIIQRDSVEAQKEYLDGLAQSILSGPFDRQGLTYLRDEANVFIAYHAGKGPGAWDTLRRYRALANVRMMAQTPDSKSEDWLAAREDLLAAIAADPSDFQAVSTLDGVLLELSDRARAAGRTEEAEQRQREADAVIEAYRAANPDDPVMQLAMLRREFGDQVRAFQARVRAATDAGQTPPDPVEAAREFTRGAVARLDRATEAARAKGPAAVTPELVDMLRALEAAIDPANRLARTRRLIEDALATRTDSLTLLSAKAEIAAQLGEFDEAIRVLQQIIDQPNRRVSLEGARIFGFRDSARFLQALWSIRAHLALETQDPQVVSASLKRAKAFQEAFARSEAQDSIRRMMVDAWMAYVDRDPVTTNRLLTSINRRQPISDSETLVLWAQTALQTNEPGAARERLMRVLDVQPNNINAGLVFGQLCLQLQDYAQAETTFGNILRLQPDNAAAQRGLEIARAGRGAGEIGDPVQQAIMTAIRMQREGAGKPETDGQINLYLTERVEALNYAPQLVRALTTTRLGLGDREGALRIVERALEKYPGDVLLTDIRTTLTSADPTEAQLRIIDSRAEVPELNRRLARYTVLQRAGRSAEARGELDALVRLAPDDENVIEMQFLDALSRRDWDTAGRLADQAGRLNLDKAEGRTFRARLLAVRGDTKAASDLMQQIIEGGGATPEVYRLHGRMLSQMGRHAEALTSFQEALRLRPNDPGAIRDVVTSLVTQGRRDQALVAAREGARFAENDPEFLDLWLRIEAEFGNLPMVITRRERMAAANPKDRANMIELGRLLIRTGELAKARTTIDRLRADGDDLEGAALDASWHWARNDRQGAFRVFDAYVDARADQAQKLQALMDFAQFLYGRRDIEGSLSVLERARSVQNPTVMEADKAIAETHFTHGSLEQAVEVMRRILSANADSEDSAYRKRLVEALMRLGRTDEAERELAPLLASRQPDLVSQLLEADLRVAQGKRPEARVLLDRIITRFPTEAPVFIKRGQLLMREQETYRDALADFGRAIQLNPNSWQAHRLRAALHGRMGNTADALTDLRTALRLNPTDDEMLVSLVTDLLRLGRDQEAEQAAADALAGRPREALVYARVAGLFAQVGRPVIAAKFYEQAFELDANDGVTQSYLDSLLNAEPPNLTKAEEVLRRLGDRVGKNPGFMMALGKVRAAQGQVPQAQRAALDAIRMLDPANGRVMLIWHEDMGRLIPSPPRYIEFLDASIRAGVVPHLNEWLAFFRAEVQSREPSIRETALQTLADLSANSRNPALRQFVHRLRGSLLFQMQRPDEAVEVWTVGVREFPLDGEMNNNLAYLLAKRERFSEALPLAEAAVRAIPESADVVDTLGYVQMRLGRLEDAEQTFRTALVYVRTAQQGLLVGAHLVECLHLRGKTEDARKVIVDLEKVLAADGARIPPDAVAEYQRVKALIK